MIVQPLLEIQNKYGYLPDEELAKLAERLDVRPHKIEEVASFFPAFRRDHAGKRPPGLLVRVCRDMTCHHKGAKPLTAALRAEEEELSRIYLEHRTAAIRAENEVRVAARRIPLPMPTETDCKVVVEGVSCLGRCDRAPAVWVERFPMPHMELDFTDPTDKTSRLCVRPKRGGGHGHEDHAWVYAGRTTDGYLNVLTEIARGKQPPADTDRAYRVNTNAGSVDGDPPYHRWAIDPYSRAGRKASYDAVKKVAAFIADQKGGLPLPPPKTGGNELDAFIESRLPLLYRFKVANVLGMGGAGMLAYEKWRDLWQAKWGEKYIVANGDESEPGTFKDRELLLRAPHLVVEGVIVAGLLTGATKGFVYIRHEYHEQIAAVRAEIERATRDRACGADIFGHGLDFDVDVFESPGGYVCGEQSALLEAMEDRRSQPRNRPPELTANGFKDKPTAVNNVETLSWAPSVILDGGPAPDYTWSGWQVPADQWKAIPTLPGYAGRRLFSVSGDVRRPGVYEVPVGMPLGELLESPEYCSGLTGEFTALAPSGPSGGLIPGKIPLGQLRRDRFKNLNGVMKWFVERHLKEESDGNVILDLKVVPLDLNFWRQLNSLLGLGDFMLGAGIGVYAGPFDVHDLAVNFTEFYRNESCGKCVPCRLGSEKLVQLGVGLLNKSADWEPTKALVEDIHYVLNQTSICALGQSAPVPLRTAMKYFPAGRPT